MCTSIVEVVPAEGSAKGPHGWFKVTHSVVTYDHPHYAFLDDSINIDFLNESEGPSVRAAVELSLESAKALQAALTRAIDAAEREEALSQHPLSSTDASLSSEAAAAEGALALEDRSHQRVGRHTAADLGAQ